MADQPSPALSAEGAAVSADDLFDLLDHDGDDVIRYDDLRAMAHTVLTAFGHCVDSPVAAGLDRDYRALWAIFDTRDGCLTRAAFRMGAATADFDRTFGPVVHAEFTLAAPGGGDRAPVANIRTLLGPLNLSDPDAAIAHLDPHATGYITRSGYYAAWHDYLTL